MPDGITATITAEGDLDITIDKDELAALLSKASPPVDAPPGDPTPPVDTDPAPPADTTPPAPPVLGVAASYDATTKQIHVVGSYAAAAPVLVYFAAAGKPIGAGSGTGRTTLPAKPAGTPFAFNLAAPAVAGSYAVLCAQGTLSEAVTVDVPAATPPATPTDPGGSTKPPPPIETPPVETPPVVEPPVVVPPASKVLAVPLLTSKVEVAARPISFGRPWAMGQLTGGLSYNGQPVQVDVLMRHDDGSAKFTMLTLPAPALAAGAGIPCPLVAAPTAAATAIDLSAATIPLQVRVTIGGVVHLLDVGAALKSPSSYELRGPLVSDGRVDLPVTNALHLVVDARVYADGRHWMDVQLRNDLALGTAGGDLTYDVEIVYGGSVVFAKAGIRQWQYQHWHREIWSDNAPVHHVAQDAAEFIETGFVFPYDLKTGADPSCIKPVVVGPRFDVLGAGDLPQYMGQTGVGPYIGADPGWGAAWVMLQTEEARAYALAQSDAAASIPWHFWVAADNGWVDVTKHPRLWVDNRGVAPNGELTQAIPARNGPAANQLLSGWTLDAAHQPSTHWLPAIYTGSRYRRDLLAAQAAWAIAGMNPGKGYRDGAAGIVVTPQTQVRGIAWSLLAIARAAALCRDQNAYFAKVLANNLAYLQAEAATGSQGEASFWVPGVYGSTPDELAPWQQDYVGWALAQIVCLGNAAARDVLRSMIGYLAGRAIKLGVNGFTYNLVKSSTVIGANSLRVTTNYTKWGDMLAATAALSLTSGKGPAPNGWTAADGKPWPPNTFLGYYMLALSNLRFLAREFPDDARCAAARDWLTANAQMATPAQFRLQPNYSLAA